MSLKQKGKGKRSANGPDTYDTDESGIKKLKNGSSNTNGNHSPVVQYKFSSRLVDLKSKLSAIWKHSEEETFSDISDIELIRDPFQCCCLQNVVENSEDLFDHLLAELKDVDMCEKNNDLYKFKQSSKDLKHLHESPYISGLKEFLETDVREWLQTVTGIELNKEIDLFCANYGYTDHLLCHDDELEGRRIAFIMYFVKNWTPEDGGTLDLFKCNDQGQPVEVARSLVPKTNSMAFFEVTEKSHHQVAEILTKDKHRFSVGGWFHGTPYVRPTQNRVDNDVLEAVSSEDIDEDEFYSWINPMYLDLEIQTEINAKFEETSEISLPNFLEEDKFKAVSEAMRKVSNWRKKGPSNQRCIDVLIPCEEEILQKCVKFLRSDATFLLMSNLTGLRLHPLAPENDDEESEKEATEESDHNNSSDEDAVPSTSTVQDPDSKSGVKSKKSGKFDPKCKIEVRRWRQGCYTLLNDARASNDKYCLDGRLFFNCHDWSIEYGGFTSYVAKDEDEELLTAMPENNTLQLIYKDAQTLGFVKYVNDGINALPNGEFHDIALAYFE